MAWFSRRLLGEWIRFCIIGAMSAAMNMGIIVALTELLHFHYMLSTLLCFCIVNIFGFIMNRGWSFRVRSRFLWGEPLRYAAVALIGVVLTLWTSWMLVTAGLPYYIAVYLSAILLAPYNFVAHRFLTFREAGTRRHLSP